MMKPGPRRPNRQRLDVHPVPIAERKILLVHEVEVASGSQVRRMAPDVCDIERQVGRDFALQLVMSVFGVALLVGAGGATLSVRAHLAK